MASYNTLLMLPHARAKIKLSVRETASRAALFDQRNLKFCVMLGTAGRDGCCQFASVTLFSLVSVKNHRGGLQGLLLTCNNSRGYGLPPLPNMTPGSSPGNGKSGDTTHPTGGVICSSMKLSVGYLGNIKMSLRGRIKRKFCRAGFDKSPLGFLLPFVLGSTSHFF